MLDVSNAMHDFILLGTFHLKIPLLDTHSVRTLHTARVFYAHLNRAPFKKCLGLFPLLFAAERSLTTHSTVQTELAFRFLISVQDYIRKLSQPVLWYHLIVIQLLIMQKQPVLQRHVAVFSGCSGLSTFPHAVSHSEPEAVPHLFALPVHPPTSQRRVVPLPSHSLSPIVPLFSTSPQSFPTPYVSPDMSTHANMYYHTATLKRHHYHHHTYRIHVLYPSLR